MATRPIQIVKNGNASVVTIPRRILRALGWQLGDFVVPEVLEDRTVRYRLPTLRDVQPDRLAPFLPAIDAPKTP